MNLFSEESWKQFREILGLKESPLGIYYTNDKPEGVTPKTGIQLCMIGLFRKRGKTGRLSISIRAISDVLEALTTWGFWTLPRPNIEYFLSCGIPGEMEGERYIKTPELAREYFGKMKPRPAPATYCVFKPYRAISRRR